MKKNENKEQIQAGNSPLKQGMKTAEDLFNDNAKRIKSLNYMSITNITCKDDEYNLPNQNKFLYSKWNKKFHVEKKKTKIVIKLISMFLFHKARRCTLVHNDKSNNKPTKYYLVDLINEKGIIERDIEISNNSKTDYKQFQSVLNSKCNDFSMNMLESEFKTFISEDLSQSVTSDVTLYTNAGVLEPGKFLYENALATKNGIIWADENGYIKVGKNSYIKIAETKHNLPKLAKSIKTGKQIANELMTNIIECWSEDIILPLIVLGQMLMAIHYEEFVKRHGVPTLIIFGETGTGKSTLVTVGLAIFGLSRSSLKAGGSSAKSNEYYCSKYNGINICIDDVKGQTLNSSNFTALIEGVYKGIARTKMSAYGKEVIHINICSPLSYSTNAPLPNLKEVINRLNIVEIFGKVFKADKFKYHEFNKENKDNLTELSLILPEMLKYSQEEVLAIYDYVYQLLQNNVKDTQDRIISNIAYASTGAILLLDIADIQIADLDNKILDYANKQIAKYEDIKNIVDKVLVEISNLFHMQVLGNGEHFKICHSTNEQGKAELQIRFRKGVVISLINKFYSYDKSKYIDETLFTSYAKNHPRYRGHKTARYGENNSQASHSICFDITNMEEFSEFVTATSFQDFKESLEGNTM